MILPEELRIGNYVTVNNPNYHAKLKDVVLEVTGINPNTWKGKSTYAISLGHINQEENKYYETIGQFIKYIEPIPLTEQWLKDFGFKPLGKDWVKDLCIVHTRKRGYVIRATMSPIKTVHRLQNYFYSVKEKELAKQ